MKHWLVRICVLLVLGAIVNVAVAWGCAATSRLTIETRDQANGSDYRVVELEGETLDDARILIERRGRGFSQRSIPLEDSLERTIIIKRWNEAMALGGGIITPDLEAAFLFRVDAGWPLPSTRSDIWDHSLAWMEARGHPLDEGTYRIVCGILVGTPLPPKPTWQLNLDRHRVLPLRPIWPGFAINTVFYAGVLWLLFAAPFALRKRRRIKRGLCPKCAYPVGTSDKCTECGSPVVKRHHAPTEATSG